LCLREVVRGGTIDPGGLVGGLARAATAAGATIHEHARVDALEPGTPVPVRTAPGTVLADRVCPPPTPPAPIPALGRADGVPFYTLDLPYLWGRLVRDGRLVLGAGLVGTGDGAVTGLLLDGAEGRGRLSRAERRLAG